MSEETVKPKYDNKFKAGLWPKTSKKGTNYIGGHLEDYWVSYFNNDYREEAPNSPHGTLMLSPKEKGDEDLTLKVKMFRRIGKKGTAYLSGKVSGDSSRYFNIFENSNKKSPKAPDYHLVINDVAIEPKTEEGENLWPQETAAHDTEDPGFIKDPEAEVNFSDDDLPF